MQIHFIACVTAGLAWPNGAPACHPSNVIMLTAEDTLDQEVVPRLIAAGADLKRVQIIKNIKSDGKDRQFLLGEDLEDLERAVTKVGEVGLITIDPITAYMGGKLDSHKTTEVRSQLGPLKDFAERVDVAVSTITHPPKSAGQKAIDHFIGSQAFIAAGRIGHICIAEMEEEAGDIDEETGSHSKPKMVPTGRILFANPKNNAHTLRPTLAFRVAEIIVGQDEGTNIAAPRVVWEGEVDITADEAVAASRGGGDAGANGRPGAQAEVQAFLALALKDGSLPQSEVEERAEKAGYTVDQLNKAKRRVGVISTKSGFEGGWQWALPPF